MFNTFLDILDKDETEAKEVLMGMIDGRIEAHQQRYDEAYRNGGRGAVHLANRDCAISDKNALAKATTKQDVIDLAKIYL